MNEQGTAPVEQSGNVSVTPPEVKNERADFVTLETHRRLLDEKKKAQAKLDELLAKEKEREEADAKKRGDYEAILKAREEELQSERAKRLEIEGTLTQGRKLSAVIDALGGSVDPRWYKLIDISNVAINPESGEVDALTVAKVAESLKREWPEMLRATSKLPANAPQGLEGGSGKISREAWKKLPSKEMLKWKPDQIVD